ncbi:MAG TPA: AarF/UbiB family protein [Acidimicrobiia bacterium]|nr:AarF/UbiB family protein [Acidimicrobiia bacterium]
MSSEGGPEPANALASDVADFGFSDRGPWVVDPDAMSWRVGLEALRERANAEAPRLLKPRKVPPVRRVLDVSARVGVALGIWYAVERRQEPSARRRALSRRLRVAFAHLGPTYIKMGQIVSSGEGLFPEELVSEFKLLRDRVPPETFEHVREVVEADLGKRIEAVFSRFEREPIAAASIAQVHAATLHTGEEVVVKVQRPKVARLVREDLQALAWLAPRLIGRIPVAALANPPALVELFAETIVEELDFRLEAENMLDIARVLAETGQRATIVPRPHPRYVTRRVLVMERLDGFAWDDVASMKRAGVDTEAVLHAGLVAFMEGAMLYGVFHGDLHGGNLRVQPDGRTALMDFGITGRLTPLKRIAFLFLLMGATTGDIRAQLGALRDLGAFPADTDLDAVSRDLGLDQPLVDPTTLSADELVHQLQDLTKQLLAYGARAPKELMLFVKNMMFLDGAIATLAPDLDILEEIQKVHMEIGARHGERLAMEMGVDPALATVFDAASVKAAMGLPADVEKLTYRDVQARRELIRSRFEARRKGGS